MRDTLIKVTISVLSKSAAATCLTPVSFVIFFARQDSKTSARVSRMKKMLKMMEAVAMIAWT